MTNPSIYDLRKYGNPANPIPTFGDIRSAVQSGTEIPDHWWRVEGAWDYLDMDKGLSLVPDWETLISLVQRLFNHHYNFLTTPIPLYTARGQVCLDLTPFEFWRYAHHVSNQVSPHSTRFLPKTWEALVDKPRSYFNLVSASPLLHFFKGRSNVRWRPEPKTICFLSTNEPGINWWGEHCPTSSADFIVVYEPCLRLWQDEIERILAFMQDTWVRGCRIPSTDYDPLCIFKYL